MREPAALLAFLALTACASTHIQSIRTADDTKNIDAYEKRLWSESREFDLAMAKAQRVYVDAATTAYLQSIMDRLYPEFKGIIKVRIADSTDLNAFALPNGSVYFNVGLIARLDNEAQIATVLGHEAGHFIHKHGYKQRENIKNSSAFALGVALVGVPVVGDLIATSSIYGYSQDLEREADQVAFVRIVKAGYDPRESAKTFEHLANEVQALGLEEPYFFSSHPKLSERIESFRALSAGYPPGGRIGKADFERQVANLRLAALAGDLSRDRYKSVILALGTEKGLSSYPPQAHYYLGEAYYRRGKDGDGTAALFEFERAQRLAPDFPPTYRALGIHYFKQKDFARAQAHLGKYLNLASDAPDRAYIQQYFELCKREKKP